MRMIQQGGVKLNGEKVAEKTARVPAGMVYVAQVGKRKFARVTLS
jgi:tyrosyl-tRNA synthetase